MLNKEWNPNNCNPEELRIWAKVKNQWETETVITSYWRDKANHHRDCAVTRRRKISSITGEVKDFFQITGWQVFPIKGEFESSYSQIACWLHNNGWELRFIREVRYEKY